MRSQFTYLAVDKRRGKVGLNLGWSHSRVDSWDWVQAVDWMERRMSLPALMELRRMRMRADAGSGC